MWPVRFHSDRTPIVDANRQLGLNAEPNTSREGGRTTGGLIESVRFCMLAPACWRKLVPVKFYGLSATISVQAGWAGRTPKIVRICTPKIY